MMSFLKNFLNGDQSVEAKALAATQNKHDVLVLDASDEQSAETSCDDDDMSASYGGCCGGGCRQ